ncbi:hypothetical protein GCM10010430_62560 [Kitasatospora cystarginea]|uniref:Uncharacterized protein n=1 Tax=Kitasatospora cystarginea TaxID=58350 RepID=A0ABN3ET10_9ACTN
MHGPDEGREQPLRLIADPLPYRENAILRGPEQLPVSFERLGPDELAASNALNGRVPQGTHLLSPKERRWYFPYEQVPRMTRMTRGTHDLVRRADRARRDTPPPGADP